MVRGVVTIVGCGLPGQFILQPRLAHAQRQAVGVVVCVVRCAHPCASRLARAFLLACSLGSARQLCAWGRCALRLFHVCASEQCFAGLQHVAVASEVGPQGSPACSCAHIRSVASGVRAGSGGVASRGRAGRAAGRASRWAPLFFRLRSPVPWPSCARVAHARFGRRCASRSTRRPCAWSAIMLQGKVPARLLGALLWLAAGALSLAWPAPPALRRALCWLRWPPAIWPWRVARARLTWREG